MIPTGVQQFMLGTALNNETQARQTLAALKNAGTPVLSSAGL